MILNTGKISAETWLERVSCERPLILRTQKLPIISAIRHALLLSLSAMGLCGVTGCLAFHNTAISGPDTPRALQVRKETDSNVLNEIKNFYYNRCLGDTTALPPAPLATPAANCGTQQEQRNIIIYDLKRIIDSNYDAYGRHFQQTADTTSFAGEVAAASLTAVSTLVGATDLKNILTTASTLTQSTNVSVQKNYFQKQTEYAILAEMDADRAKQWAIIVQRIEDDLSSYSLSAALDDLQQYKRAGSATAALTAITQQAGAQKSTSNEQVKKTLGVQ